VVSVHSPWCSVDSGPVVRQNIMVAGACGGGGCLPHATQEAEKEEGVWGPGITFKGMPPGIYFLQLAPPPEVSTASQNRATI
jgi:hypothetical protein